MSISDADSGAKPLSLQPKGRGPGPTPEARSRQMGDRSSNSPATPGDTAAQGTPSTPPESQHQPSIPQPSPNQPSPDQPSPSQPVQPSLEPRLHQLIEASLFDLQQRRQTLQQDIEQLEQRKERIEAEMRTSFAGTSQDLAIRMQGFKDYLVGSLQDLATAAEQLELKVPQTPPSPQTPDKGTASSPPDRRTTSRSTRPPRALEVQPIPPLSAQDVQSRTPVPQPSPRPRQQPAPPTTPSSRPRPAPAAQTARIEVDTIGQWFETNAQQMYQMLDQYRAAPDYYGPPWQLRRTLEPIHTDRVSQWFVKQRGRGSLKSMGARSQNILVASTIISVLHVMYGDRVRTLILSDAPERLGDWRRGLQDCLGISRADFGGQEGVALFEAPEALSQRAERLLDGNLLPLILIDTSDNTVHLSLLQYPLWLAFAPDISEMPLYY